MARVFFFVGMLLPCWAFAQQPQLSVDYYESKIVALLREGAHLKAQNDALQQQIEALRKQLVEKMKESKP